MKTEITIRFKNDATRLRFTDTILTTAETESLNGLMGGFYFTTDRDAFTFMASIAAEGFDISDFQNIEFQPA